MVERMPERRLQILRYLARQRVESGAPPSVRQIGEAVGLKSKQTVFHHLAKLEEEGLVERSADWTRALSLTERGWQAVGEGSPLMGRISAGRGLEAVASEDAYSLAGELLLSRSGRSRYLLRVVGDSMTGAHIADGALVIVEEEPDPVEGTIVVALLSDGTGGAEADHSAGEVTVKRLYRNERQGKVILRAENSNYEDMVCEPTEVQIQGKVVYVVQSPR